MDEQLLDSFRSTCRTPRFWPVTPEVASSSLVHPANSLIVPSSGLDSVVPPTQPTARSSLVHPAIPLILIHTPLTRSFENAPGFA